MNNQTKKLITLITLFLVSTSLMVLFYYVYSNGKIIVSNSTKPGQWDKAIIEKKGSSPQTYKLGSLIKKGEYKITLSGAQGSYSETLTVRGLLKTTAVEPYIENEYHSVKISNNVSDLQIYDGSTVYSIKYGSRDLVYSVHSASNNFPYVVKNNRGINGDFMALGVLNDSFVGISSGKINGVGFFFALFNPKTNTIKYLNSPDGNPLNDESDTSNTHILADNGSDSFIGITVDGVFIYKPLDSYSKKLPFSNQDYSIVKQKPLVSYAGGVVSGVSGVATDDSEEAGDGKDPSNTTNKLTIKRYDVNTDALKQTLKINLSYTPTGFSQSVSAEKYLLFNSESASVFMGNKLQKTIGTSIGEGRVFWRDERRVAFVDPSVGLMSLDTQTGNTSTLFNSPLYSYSDFNFLKNNNILVTCYLKTPDSRIDTGAMLIKLVKQENPINSLTTSLPYAALQYSLDTFNDKVYFTALSFGSNDPVYEKSITERQQTSSQILKTANKYLDKSNIKQDVIIDVDIRSPEEFIVY